LLARLLASCAANENAHGRHYRYVVLDDSRDARSRAANAEHARHAGATRNSSWMDPHCASIRRA
jgi:hypothetical protein